MVFKVSRIGYVSEIKGRVIGANRERHAAEEAYATWYRKQRGGELANVSVAEEKACPLVGVGSGVDGTLNVSNS